MLFNRLSLFCATRMAFENTQLILSTPGGDMRWAFTCVFLQFPHFSVSIKMMSIRSFNLSRQLITQRHFSDLRPIKIPERIERGPTDILEALASTVRRVRLSTFISGRHFLMFSFLLIDRRMKQLHITSIMTIHFSSPRTI